MTATREQHRGRQKPEYSVWCAMKRRCYGGPAVKSFADYGARGITVHPAWVNSFATFLADVGPRPSSAHTIDRERNDEAYAPGNCKWATRTEQNRNRRGWAACGLGIPGVTVRAPGFKAGIKAGGKYIYLGQFDDFFEACCARKSAENKYWGAA